jgi:hypothetical protein
LFSKHESQIIFSKTIFLLRSTIIPGNKSPKRPKKTSESYAVILGILKSLNALIRIAYSEISGSERLKLPATTKTDLMALRPQS